MTSQLAVTWIGTIIIFGMYSLPGYVALHRQHKNAMPIFLTNVLFGWTGIGWIGCLIWSVSDHVQAKEVLPVEDQTT
jgi:TM2 domain-containing membrane protein YozV